MQRKPCARVLRSATIIPRVSMSSSIVTPSSIALVRRAKRLAFSRTLPLVLHKLWTSNHTHPPQIFLLPSCNASRYAMTISRQVSRSRSHHAPRPFSLAVLDSTPGSIASRFSLPFFCRTFRGLSPAMHQPLLSFVAGFIWR